MLERQPNTSEPMVQPLQDMMQQQPEASPRLEDLESVRLRAIQELDTAILSLTEELSDEELDRNTEQKKKKRTLDRLAGVVNFFDDIWTACPSLKTYLSRTGQIVTYDHQPSLGEMFFSLEAKRVIIKGRTTNSLDVSGKDDTRKAGIYFYSGDDYRITRYGKLELRSLQELYDQTVSSRKQFIEFIANLSEQQIITGIDNVLNNRREPKWYQRLLQR